MGFDRDQAPRRDVHGWGHLRLPASESPSAEQAAGSSPLRSRQQTQTSQAGDPAGGDDQMVDHFDVEFARDVGNTLREAGV
jgi:hypothetical protein